VRLVSKTKKGDKYHLKLYYWIAIAVLIILGIVTLIPAPGMPLSLLGYAAVDPYSPISAIVLFVIAIAVYWLGKRSENKK
jgi:hypothetical protein